MSPAGRSNGSQQWVLILCQGPERNMEAGGWEVIWMGGWYGKEHELSLGDMEKNMTSLSFHNIICHMVDFSKALTTDSS